MRIELSSFLQGLLSDVRWKVAALVVAVIVFYAVRSKISDPCARRWSSSAPAPGPPPTPSSSTSAPATCRSSPAACGWWGANRIACS
jgi:hypothetical protein